MSNMNKDLKVEIKLGEYMDLVAKANQWDETKNMLLAEVSVNVMGEADNTYVQAVIGSSQVHLAQRLQRLYELIAEQDEVVEILHRLKKQYFCVSGQYFTDYCFSNEDYKNLLEVEAIKNKWELLDKKDIGEVEVDE